MEVVSAGGCVTTSGIRGSSDRSVLVLTSLAGGPKHGYALIQDIEQFAGVTLGPGTLYGCLSKLEEAGLVESMPAEERRHPYRITSVGLAAVENRLRESARIARFGLKRIAGAVS
jgi:DNA-binding PadR family transcriptional regulator